MTRKILVLIGVSLLGMMLLLSGVSVSPAAAQSEVPAPESACATCHENLYVLHDTGKWYCSCKRRADCTVCHAGQADAFDEDLAHKGLIASPIQDNPAVCQSCHGDEYLAYIERFTLIAGVSQPSKPGTAYAPAAMYIETPVQQSGALVFIGKSYQPWQLIALGILAGFLMGVFLFGCRCWKKDRSEGRL
jgi:hypothetical protein